MKPVFFAPLLAAACLPWTALAAEPASGDWPSYGHDVAATRYSPLSQINPANVSKLALAWRHHMRPPAASGEASVNLVSETTPLAIDGVVYLSSPLGAVWALDGDSGRQIWSIQLPDGDAAASRGFQYWAGDRTAGARLIIATRMGRILAVSPQTGALIPSFGQGGVVSETRLTDASPLAAGGRM